MNILITGGAGFIGSWLCNRYLKKGHTVYVLDDLSTGKRSNIRGVDEENIMIGNVANEYVVRFFRSIDLDMIMHFASPASPTRFGDKAEAILDANIIGTRNMLNLALNNEAKFIFASTSEVYGNPPRSALPLKEIYNGNVNPVGIRGCYDEGKRAGEAYCKAYERKYRMDIGIVRIFNTYGPYMPDDGRAIPTFIKRSLTEMPIPILGTGKQTRAFLYVQDLIDGIEKYAELSGYANCSPMNLGATQEHSVIEIARRIQMAMQVRPIVKFYDRSEDDPEYRLPDITLAYDTLGWKPRIPLGAGLDATIDYFRNL
jgi:nucleoside-diphosphate-sugar epimerase